MIKRRRLAGYLLIVCAALGASVAGSFAQDSKMVDAIKKRGVVRVAVDVAPPNLILNAQTSAWEGVFVDLVNDWAKELGVKTDYQQTTFTNMVAAVQADRADLALDLTVNPERLKGVKFSIPVRNDVGVFLIGKTMPGVSSFDDLNKPQYKICVQKGGVYDVALEPVDIKAEMLKLPNAAACFAALDAGRVDAMFWGWGVAAQYSNANAARGAGIIFSPEPYVRSDISNAVSLNYSDADLEPLNDFTAKWIKSPDGLKASLRRWNADASPLDHAIGPVPDYVKQAIPGTFGVN